MGNDGACKIVGIGNVWLLTSIGYKMMLKDVHHVPDIRLNPILVGRLDHEGYSSNIRNGTWKFCKGNLRMARAKKQNTLYVLHAQMCQNEVNLATNTFSELWHKSCAK